MHFSIHAGHKGRGKKKKDLPMGPTAEQMGRGNFELGDVVDKGPNGRTIAIGKAFRRKPMIDTLHGQGILSDAEHKALRHYRHHADVADKSPTKDSLCIQRFGGSGNGPTHEVLHAIGVVRDCESAAGSLVDILRAVVVYDKSLSEWAMDQAGAVEQCRQRGNRRVCQMEPRKNALAIARMEIKMAAGRVQAELDA